MEDEDGMPLAEHEAPRKRRPFSCVIISHICFCFFFCWEGGACWALKPGKLSCSLEVFLYFPGQEGGQRQIVTGQVDHDARLGFQSCVLVGLFYVFRTLLLVFVACSDRSLRAE